KIKNLEKQLYQQQITLSKATEEVASLRRKNKTLEDTKQSILQDLNEKTVCLQEQKHIVQHQATASNELNEKYNNILSDNAELINKLKTEKSAALSLRINLE
ncbi:MAG: hypothetical protein ACXVZU_01105, partial [Methanobacteriaceae archaeon]